MDGSGPALTVAEAAQRLGVTKQRVHQLLTGGRLKGPMPAADAMRAAANSPRVWIWSVENELQSRALGRRRVPRTQERSEPVPVVAGDLLARELETARAEIRTLKSIAQSYKVRYDAVEEDLASAQADVLAARREVKDLLRSVEDLTDEKRQLQGALERAERRAEQHGDALGMYLSPDSLADL